MNDMRLTIVPKSDQLNADDLIGRGLTITVSKVLLSVEADQPVAVHYEGDNGKPYKPCKSMRRVMVTIWGPDASKYTGREMRLYRDEKVVFGGQPVGGIRISHMSDIDSDVTMALTASRANRKPYTVKPLVHEPGAPVRQPSKTEAKPPPPRDEIDATIAQERAVEAADDGSYADILENQIVDALSPEDALTAFNAAIKTKEWMDLRATDPQRSEQVKARAMKRKAEMATAS